MEKLLNIANAKFIQRVDNGKDGITHLYHDLPITAYPSLSDIYSSECNLQLDLSCPYFKTVKDAVLKLSVMHHGVQVGTTALTLQPGINYTKKDIEDLWTMQYAKETSQKTDGKNYGEGRKETILSEQIKDDKLNNRFEGSVPVSAYKQAVAERDIAIGQLEDLGTFFGEKPEIAKQRMEDKIMEKVNIKLSDIADKICEYLDMDLNPDDRDGVIRGLMRGEPLELLIDITADMDFKEL